MEQLYRLSVLYPALVLILGFIVLRRHAALRSAVLQE